MGWESEIDALKKRLIEEWDRPFRKEPEQHGFRYEVSPGRMPPRTGLAIGHGLDPRSGRPRLEFLASASSGPDRDRIDRLARRARLEGLDVVIRTFSKIAMLMGEPPDPLAGTCFHGRRVPLRIGGSVAHEKGYAGTIGAFVTFGGGKLGLLSCAHVLAEAPRTPNIARGDHIQHPGMPEEVFSCNRIGTLSEHFSRFIPARTDNIDAAVAEISEGIETLGNVIPDLSEIPAAFRGRPIGMPLSDSESVLNLDVIKVGRQTGLTYGTIISADVKNFAPDFRRRKRITFGRVHVVAARMDQNGVGAPVSFTERGDSGSLVLTEEGLRPVGIHFCASELTDGQRVSFMIPWSRIAGHLPIELA